jgi:hypothetical protein
MYLPPSCHSPVFLTTRSTERHLPPHVPSSADESYRKFAARRPHDLGDWCASLVMSTFGDGAERTAATIARSGVAGANPPTAEELRRAAELLIQWFKDSQL